MTKIFLGWKEQKLFSDISSLWSPGSAFVSLSPWTWIINVLLGVGYKEPAATQRHKRNETTQSPALLWIPTFLNLSTCLTVCSLSYKSIKDAKMLKCTCVGALHGGVRHFYGGDINLCLRDIKDLLTATGLVRQQDRHWRKGRFSSNHLVLELMYCWNVTADKKKKHYLVFQR